MLHMLLATIQSAYFLTQCSHMLHMLQCYMCYNPDIVPNALYQVFLAPHYLGKCYEDESWSLVLNRDMWLALATV